MPSPRCPVLLHATHGSPSHNAHSVARPSKFSPPALLCKRPASSCRQKEKGSCTPSCAFGGPSSRLYRHSPCLRLRLLDQLPLRRSQVSVCPLVALDFADLCLRHKVRSWISVVATGCKVEAGTRASLQVCKGPTETEMGGVGCLDSYTADLGFLGGFRKSDLRRVPRRCGANSSSIKASAEPLVKVPNQLLKTLSEFRSAGNPDSRPFPKPSTTASANVPSSRHGLLAWPCSWCAASLHSCPLGDGQVAAAS